MASNGLLNFHGTNKATFVGENSNIVFDTVNSSLGIGITGTDSPTSNLYITGNAYVTSDISVGGVLNMGIVDVSARYGLEAVTAVDASTPETITLTNTGTSLVASGNVGIGTTTSPGYLLDVQSTSDAADKNMTRLYSAANASGVSSTGLRVEKGTGYGGIVKGFISQGVGSGLSLHTLNSGTDVQAMTIMNSGNVGIGTTSPGALLHVNGDIAVGANGSLRRTADNDLINIYAGSDNTSPYMFMTGKSRSSNANKIGFRIASATKFELYSDKAYFADNVGIGKTAPSTALDVNGIIKQTGANWALTNASVPEDIQYRGAYPGDYAYLNRTLSTPTNVTLTHENQGGYNTRSRITVGTTGKYAMYINGFRQTGTSGTKEMMIYKNGVYVSVRAYSGPEGTSNYATVGSAYTIMDLNANDYVEVKILQGAYHGNDSIYFAGHLIA